MTRMKHVIKRNNDEQQKVKKISVVGRREICGFRLMVKILRVESWANARTFDQINHSWNGCRPIFAQTNVLSDCWLTSHRSNIAQCICHMARVGAFNSSAPVTRNFFNLAAAICRPNWTISTSVSVSASMQPVESVHVLFPFRVSRNINVYLKTPHVTDWTVLSKFICSVYATVK